MTLLPTRTVGPPRQLGGAGDDGEHLVDLVEVVHVLQQVGHALQAHPGVDVLARQVEGNVEVVLGPDRRQLLLGEHQVPDLQVAVLVDHRAALGTVRRSAVDVDLAARSAGTGDAHVPVVVQQPAPLDPLLRQPGDAGPQGGRLVVGVQHGDPDRVRVEAEAAVVDGPGDQFPGEADGLGLEVVTEGEVAHHLEEGAVPGGAADLLDVEGPHALLHAGGPVERWRLRPGEVRLERHHAGVDEQQGRVVVEQRCGRHHLVAAGAEIVQEAAPDIGGSHRVVLAGWSMTGGFTSPYSRIWAEAVGVGAAFLDGAAQLGLPLGHGGSEFGLPGPTSATRASGLLAPHHPP